MTPTKERVRLHRQRQAAVIKLSAFPAIDILWEVLILFQHYPFRTTKGLKFTFTIRGNEMFVDRKEKSITKATVGLALDKALALGNDATGPKKLGCFGASYLYPVFVRLGVIKLPLLEKK